MRVAAVLLLLCAPVAGLAQPKPPAPAAASHAGRPEAAPGGTHGATVAPTRTATHGATTHAPTHSPVHGRPHGGTAGKPGAKPPAKPPAPAPTPAPVAPAPEAAAPPPRRQGSGLPIPRFASLKTDDVNFRRGPSSQSPVDWVYKRRDLPVEIEREFDNYRLVRDPQGTRGWVHQATLSGRRTAVVLDSERVLRESAAESAAAVAKVKAGVIVRLRRCEQGSEWCQVQIGEYSGFLKRSDVWGLLPGEVIP